MRAARLPLATLALVVVHHHSAGFDYAGLFLAAVTSWAAGLPGPGEAALIAAGLSAAHHHLALTSVLAVAWVGATMGGVLGWVLGRIGGRGLLAAPGPLQHLRLRLIARGDRFYQRYGSIAVFVTPPWVAGMHAMRRSRFVPAIAISAMAWALAVGLGAYLLGPSISDILVDAGLAGAALAGALIVVGVVLLLRRRTHRPPESAP